MYSRVTFLVEGEPSGVCGRGLSLSQWWCLFTSTLQLKGMGINSASASGDQREYPFR